jgi:hypothetical protein
MKGQNRQIFQFTEFLRLITSDILVGFLFSKKVNVKATTLKKEPGSLSGKLKC